MYVTYAFSLLNFKIEDVDMDNGVFSCGYLEQNKK